MFLLTASSSTSMAKNTMEVYLSASSQYAGVMDLQGLHQCALKFAITCWIVFKIKHFVWFSSEFVKCQT